MENNNKENKEMRKPEECAHWKLYLKGKHTWNNWVNGDLGLNGKQQLEAKIGQLPQVNDLVDFSNVDFESFETAELSDKKRENKINFSGFIFPTDVTFRNSTFSQRVDFSNAKFRGRAGFTEVKLEKGGDFQRTTFDQLTSFNSASLGFVQFPYAEFHGAANFNGTTFLGGAMFSDGIFHNHVSFQGRHGVEGKESFGAFEKTATFADATFEKGCSFKDRVFKNDVNFNNCKFGSATSFENAEFEIPPKFHDAELHQDTSFYNTVFHRKDTDQDVAARAWQTLKLAMNVKHNHKDELRFFGYEMDANHKNNKIRCQSFETPMSASLVVISTFIYKLLSNYGRSAMRPFISLIAIGLIFSGLYMCFTDCWSAAIKLSIACSFPFIGLTKSVIQEISTNPDVLLIFIVAVHTVFSFVLLFLIGLGFRNQFAIK